jgi:hypothetical protein
MFGVTTQRAVQEVVLEYLNKYGEQINAEIKIEGIDSKQKADAISKLVRANKLTKRQVTHKNKLVWCYRVPNSGPKEPEYLYILRNLPRNKDD